jgi:periplasmic divalent cation tolerance protein
VDLTESVAARVKELHPYELPEILELAAAGGSPAYLDWIRTETQT